VQAQWVTSIDELKSLGRRYDDLVLSAGDAGLFYQVEWLERVWPYFKSKLGGTLSFLIAEEGGELVAVAPLVLVIKNWIHARQRVLSFIGGTWDELDNWMPGFLFAGTMDAERDTIMRMFSETLAIHREAWDVLDLRLVRTSCPSHAALQSQFHSLHAGPDQLTTPRARLDTGWASYWAGRSKRLKRIVGRGLKRAVRDGLPVVHEVTPDIPIARRDEVEQIHRARQAQIRATGRVRSSPFEDPLGLRVFWSLIDWAAARGALRAHWLRIGDRTAAYVFVLHHSNTSFAYFNAINPSAERYHPGSLVLAGMIEREATEYGARIIDMMAGANLTKTLMATEEISYENLSVLNPYRWRSRAKQAWIDVAKRIAVRLGRR
jgi:CelD/BcsL family acetyltransferase involved in cellulose biosynthesis